MTAHRPADLSLALPLPPARRRRLPCIARPESAATPAAVPCRTVPCRRAPPSDRGPTAGPCTLRARGGGAFGPPPAAAAALRLCCEGCTPAACPRGRSAQVTGLAGRFLRLLRGARVPARPFSRGGALRCARSASPPPRPSPPPAGPALPPGQRLCGTRVRSVGEALVVPRMAGKVGSELAAQGYAARSAKWCQLGGRGHHGQLLLRGGKVTGGAWGYSSPSKTGKVRAGCCSQARTGCGWHSEL